jgi:UPF0755 protein
MAEDWSADEPFVNPDDPAAAEREARRREREERRRESEERQRESGRGEPTQVTAPVVPPPERESQPKAPPLRTVAVLAAMAVAVLAVAALAYRYFHRETPPPVVVTRTISVTIPEGYSRSQTAALAKQEGLTGSYMAASKGHEGFLFPDTFELERGAPARDLVRLQLEDFRRRVRGVDMSYARSKNLTLRDVVTIASMVEREAMLEKERPLVAAVIYNRLHEGRPLGIDATTRFATGNYTRPLTESELATDSPYNTRTHAGLPPGPIGSPGLASIEAAAHPAKTDYVFYVVKPGACGEHSFTSSEAQFEADVARYEEAREAAGGESPDSC